jgi:site-specific recombinase XerD
MRPRSPAVIRISQGTLAKYADGFVRSLKHHAEETRGTYERALREFTRWCKFDKKCRFTRIDILRYRTYLLEVRKLSAVSVSTYLTSVRQFCEYLVQRKILKENPARQVSGSSRPVRHSREPLSTAEVGLVLDAVHPIDEMGLRDFAFIKLMVYCGLSEIEIVRADVCDFSTDGSSSALVVQGKGRHKKDAVVAIPKDVKDLLDQYLSVRKTMQHHDPLFTSAGNRTRGGRMTTRGVRERVNHFLEIAGVKQGRNRLVTPFSLRHTAALMMAQAGATPDEIRDRMRLGSTLTAMLYINQVQTTKDGDGSHPPEITSLPTKDTR